MGIHGRQNQKRYLLVGKNIHRSILELAFPAMLSYLLHSFYQLIDIYWIGMLGAESLAAVSGCNFMIWAFYSLADLSATGTATMVAQNVGADRIYEARVIAGQGTILVVFIAITLLFSGLIMEGWTFDWMGMERSISLLAKGYLSPILYGLTFVFIFFVFERVLHGLGDTKTPMLVTFFTLCLNLILDPLLIFGKFGFPSLGLAGAAWATVISQCIGVVLCFVVLIKKGFIPILFQQQLFSLKRMGLILKIGAPIAFGGFFFSIIYILLMRIISRFGIYAMAAIGVCHRIEGIAFFICMGFFVAASTLVAQYIGAGQKNKAQKAAWLTNFYSLCIVLIISLIFYFYPLSLIQFFTEDGKVLQIGIAYLKIIAIFEIFLSLEIVMEGAFSGAGETFPPMLVSFPLTALRIPLAWVLAVYLNIGVNGIWWAISLTTCMKGIIITLLFIQGGWKKKKIIDNQ